MKTKLLVPRIALFLILATGFIGCTSGGGSGSDSAPKSQVLPSVQVLPTVYDFGVVTLGNTPVPLEAKIQNSGSANLKVSDIVLSDANNFALDLGGGSNPCSSTSPTIGAGENCTVEVTFIPQFAALFDAALEIKSNDSNNPTGSIQLSGYAEPIAGLNVRINQVESDMQCPAAKVTAYVSVIDQGGYAVTGLLGNNFSVSENINLKNLTDFSFVAQVTEPISVSLVMDYSGSITGIPEMQNDMEDAVAHFVDQLKIGDEAEIVKFATGIEVVQGFTSDKNLLKNAIYNRDISGFTMLYDAAWQAVNDTASRQKTRKAVIILTDGGDFGGDGQPGSAKSLSHVIDLANDRGIPIFTIGLGDHYYFDVLEQMADDTGGQFFDSPASDNLRNIYAQLADILFENQYILEYISAMGVGEAADLTVEVIVSPAVMGDDTRDITLCP